MQVVPPQKNDVHQFLSLFEVQLIDHHMPTVVLSDKCSFSLAYRALAGSPALYCGEICTPSHIA